MDLVHSSTYIMWNECVRILEGVNLFNHPFKVCVVDV